jgi:hypothetical protein
VNTSTYPTGNLSSVLKIIYCKLTFLWKNKILFCM